MALVGVAADATITPREGAIVARLSTGRCQRKLPAGFPIGGVTSPLDGLARASAVNVGERYR